MAGGLAGEVHRDSIAHALRAWREAEALLGMPLIQEDSAYYERAIAAVLPELARFATVAELVGCYVLHRRALDRWAERACGAAGRSELLRGVVADAACWRRCRALVIAAVT